MGIIDYWWILVPGALLGLYIVRNIFRSWAKRASEEVEESLVGYDEIQMDFIKYGIARFDVTRMNFAHAMSNAEFMEYTFRMMRTVFEKGLMKEDRGKVITVKGDSVGYPLIDTLTLFRR